MSFASGMQDHRLAAALLASCVVHGAAMMVSVHAGKMIAPPPASVLEVRLDAPRDPAVPQSRVSRQDPAAAEQPASRALRPHSPETPSSAKANRSLPHESRRGAGAAPIVPPPPPARSNSGVTLETPVAVLPAPSEATSASPPRLDQNHPDRVATKQVAPAAPPEAHADVAVPGQTHAAEAAAQTQDRGAAPEASLAAATPAVSGVVSEELLESYGRRISQVLGRYKEYPRMAQLRGWQGSVTMRLRVTPSGRLVHAELYSSSGHDTLDKQALAMATKAQSLPVPPDGLRDRDVVVLVPIVFRLERESVPSD